MSAPTIVSKDVHGFGADTTSPGITLPSSPAVLPGDIIICAWHVAGLNTSTAPVVPSGFTELIRSGSTVAAITVAAKIASGGEEGSTFTPASATISRAWTTSVFVVRGGPTNLAHLLANGNNVAATISRPVLTVTTATVDNLVLAGAAVEGGANTLTDPGSPWSPDDQAASTGSSASYATAIHATKATPGTTDGSSWTATTTGKWARWTVAIPPNVNQPPAVGSITPGYIVATVGEEYSATATATDSDGAIASWAWQQNATGTNVTAPALSGADTATVTFTPTELGAFTLQVVATDDDGSDSVPAYLPVIVTHQRDIALKVRSGGTFQSVDLI